MAGVNLQWYGQKIMKLATEANMDAMEKAAFYLEGEVKKYLSKAGTGVLYKRKRKGGTSYIEHRASKAGKPPAPNWGTLRSSITSVSNRKGLLVKGYVGSDLDKIAAKAEAGTNLEYGYYLEVGTTNIAKRPYLRPMLRKSHKKILEFFKTANK